MQKRSLLVGFGLGLLVAGILSMAFNGRARWHDGWDERYGAPITSESISEAQRGAAANVQYYAGYHRPHFWGFPFMMFLCLAPLMFLMFMGVMFGIMKRMRRRWHHRWGHHGHHGPPGEPTYYV